MAFGWLRRIFSRPSHVRTWMDDARGRGLIPVMDWGWEILYAIDADGRVVRAEDFAADEVREETDPYVRHVVLSQAAVRFPELERFRPVREPGDPSCVLCRGTGTRPRMPRMICRCGGLGWLPAALAESAWIGPAAE
jgi:hypothetical protein